MPAAQSRSESLFTLRLISLGLTGTAFGGSPARVGPALADDSLRSTISGLIRVAVSSGNLIPLTLTLSRGEREQSAIGSVAREVRRADTALGSAERQRNIPLSPRERAGVRGKLTLALRTALALPPKSSHRPKGFAPSILSCIGLWRRSAPLSG